MTRIYSKRRNCVGRSR